MTATAVIRQFDAQFEGVGAPLRAPIWRMVLRVTVPILEVAVYVFVNVMATV